MSVFQGFFPIYSKYVRHIKRHLSLKLLLLLLLLLDNLNGAESLKSR